MRVTIEIDGYVSDTRLEYVPQVGDEVELTAGMLTVTGQAVIPKPYIGHRYLVTGRRWKRERETLCQVELKRLP